MRRDSEQVFDVAGRSSSTRLHERHASGFTFSIERDARLATNANLADVKRLGDDAFPTRVSISTRFAPSPEMELQRHPGVPIHKAIASIRGRKELPGQDSNLEKQDQNLL